MHYYGPIPPTRPAACDKHGLPLLRTVCGVTEIWTCAACNAEVIDRWAKEPGSVTIQIGQSKPRP
jgi:hypothetical protein